ncbi:hypothetical protein [Nocardia heshunensis]
MTTEILTGVGTFVLIARTLTLVPAALTDLLNTSRGTLLAAHRLRNAVEQRDPDHSPLPPPLDQKRQVVDVSTRDRRER